MSSFRVFAREKKMLSGYFPLPYSFNRMLPSRNMADLATKKTQRENSENAKSHEEN